MGVLGQRSEGEETNDRRSNDNSRDNIIDLHQKYQQAKKQARQAKANGQDEDGEQEDAQEEDGVTIQLSKSATIVSAPDFNASLQELEIKPTSKVGKDLKKVASRAKYFDPVDFIGGAEVAFEMILEAYTQADLPALKDLLTKDMYKLFSDAIKKRHAAGQNLQLTVLSISEISFVAAEISSNQILITAKIVSEQNSVIYDADDKIIEGNKKAKEVITDFWTFSKPLSATGPNWYLAATGSATN